MYSYICIFFLVNTDELFSFTNITLARLQVSHTIANATLAFGGELVDSPDPSRQSNPERYLEKALVSCPPPITTCTFYKLMMGVKPHPSLTDRSLIILFLCTAQHGAEPRADSLGSAQWEPVEEAKAAVTTSAETKATAGVARGNDTHPNNNKIHTLFTNSHTSFCFPLAAKTY